MGLSRSDILTELTHLPAGTNPFRWLRDYMNTQYLPHYSKSATLQLYFNIAMLEICILLVFASLYLRYRRNHIWFFRKQISGTLIQPNISVVGCVAGLVFMTLTNVFMFNVVQASKGKLPPDLGFLTLLDTVFPGLVGELVIWSIASSYLGHLHSTQGTERSLYHWIRASNVLGIATPFVHLTAFLPLNVIAGCRYARVVVHYQELSYWLLVEAETWSSDRGEFDLQELLPALPLFEQLETSSLSLKPILRSVYVFHSVTMVLIIIVVAVISSFYLASVKRLIRVAKQNLLLSEQGIELLDQVYQTWVGLLVGIVLIELVASTYFVLVLYSAVNPLETSQTYILAVFWTNSTLGLTATGLTFWLSTLLKPISRGGETIEPDAKSDPQLRLPGVRHKLSLRLRFEASTRGRGGGGGEGEGGEPFTTEALSPVFRAGTRTMGTEVAKIEAETTQPGHTRDVIHVLPQTSRALGDERGDSGSHVDSRKSSED